MPYGFLDAVAGPSVKSAQAADGSLDLFSNANVDRAFDRFTAAEADFIASRDSFYIATVSETGWPYVQHRGGPAGFLKVLDDKTLAMPDFRGNRQFISLGNLTADNRAALFLMDYARRARLKILARVEIKARADAPDLVEKFALPGYKARIERAMLFHLEAFDWNCAQHIKPRYTEAEISAAVAPLRARLDELAAENEALRSQLARGDQPDGSRTPAAAAVHDA